MTEEDYLNRIESSIKEIESINLNDNSAYVKITKAFINIGLMPIILINYPSLSIIYRSRINTGDETFNKISQLSAPEEKYVLNYARANKPKQSLFYGSENRQTSYLEFLNHLSKVTPFEEKVSITIGEWKVLKNLNLALVFSPSAIRDNFYNKLHGYGFDNFMSTTSKELRKGVIKFFDFIGKEYSKSVNENFNNYLITCAYSNILFAYENCDGIIYPSVAYGGNGYNIVLKKDIIEAKLIKLQAVQVDRFLAVKQNNGLHEFINIASKYSNKIVDDKIIWKKDWQYW